MFGGVPSVGPADVGPDAILLDVRGDDGGGAGHGGGARHTARGDPPPRSREVSALAAAPPAGEVVVVCRSGARSARVVAWLTQNGVDAVNLAGGLGAWEAAGRPLVSETGGHPFVR